MIITLLNSKQHPTLAIATFLTNKHLILLGDDY